MSSRNQPPVTYSEEYLAATHGLDGCPTCAKVQRQWREVCAACGHHGNFHSFGTGNGVPVGVAYCDDRHGDPCGCKGFVHAENVGYDTRVVDDPDASALPFGCIHAHALRSLADAVDRLEHYHFDIGGTPADRPCLRRLESNLGTIIAHVSTGPAVGGSWVRLVLGHDGTWRDAQ